MKLFDWIDEKKKGIILLKDNHIVIIGKDSIKLKED